MGSIKEERGVLKLVHPGRYVEIHRKPIRAAEVMKRNPRHSITRPDVFDFPWIVVKPESVLLPGSVFLIVPNRKIYELLKAKEQCNHSPFSQQNQSPNNHVHQQLKQGSPVTSYAGMSSKNQRHEKCNKGLFVGREKERVGREVEEKLHILNKPFLPLSSLSSFSQTSPNCQSKTMSVDRENMFKYDWDKRSQNQEESPSRKSISCVSLTAMHVGMTEKRSRNHSHNEIWPKLNSYEDTQKEIEQELLEESSFESIPYEAKQYYQKNKTSMETESPKKDVNMMSMSNEQIKILKSCLRRPDSSIRKSLNLKVSFNIPIKKEEQ